MGVSYDYSSGWWRNRRAREMSVGASFTRIPFSLLAWCCYLGLVFYHRASAFQLSPTTKPQEIIERQLEALRGDDMAEVYRFASPANKRRVGNAVRFGEMVRSGPYRYLVRHARSEILLESHMAKSKQFLVRVISSSSSSSSGNKEEEEQSSSQKEIKQYWWLLSRCRAGEHTGSYMVDAVIPS